MWEYRIKIIETKYFKIKKSNNDLSIMYSILILLLFILNVVHGQTLSLADVIEYAQKNSPEAMKIETLKENKYWQWKSYKSNYKPQLVLTATLPSYQNRNLAVLQNDGSIAYRNVNQSQADIFLSLEQNISFTGGKLFLSSGLSRIDNINQNTHSYSGAPIFVGIEQPLFAFNNLKWMNRIEPLKYEESIKEYVENMEKVAYNTTVRYFNLLIAQISYGIAKKNLKNANTIYMIGDEKYQMGKISKNELLQLKFGLISAKKSISIALLSQQTSQLELTSYSGLQNSEIFSLSLPDSISIFQIDDTFAISKALENSQRSVEFKRSILEGKQEVERAERESNLSAILYMSYGTTNVSPQFSSIYINTQTMQTLNFSLSMPILDWGRAEAKYETAEANLKLIEYSVEQDKINFRQEVITEIEYFGMLKDLIEYTDEADKTAAERYEIARLRYISSDISLTDYNIALEEKDKAKRDYIISLRDYWLTYYSIRILTLYDFENNKQLLIENKN